MTQEERLQHIESYLIELYVLFNQTQHYHWNIVGDAFKDMHEFFEMQFTEMYESIDEIAERIRAMGGFVNIPVSVLASRSTLDKVVIDYPIDYKDMLRSVLLGHIELSKLAQGIILPCEECGDFATKQLFSEKLLLHEKSIWMINSLLTDL